MLERLREHRSSINEDQLMSTMEKIADFGDEMAVEFPQVFPDLPADEYKHTEVWHILIGSTLPQDYRLTDSSEVVQWMEERVQSLIDSF